MATLDIEIFRNRPFRAALACAVRAVRRIVPLAEESETAALLCQRIVSFSHFFAAGSLIEPVQLNEILNALEAESSSKQTSRTAELARSAVRNLTQSTALAAHILLIADQLPGSLDKAVKENRKAAFEAAKLSFTAAWNAIGAGSHARERAAGFSSDEIEITVAAFEKDLRTLATVHFESDDWLGYPFDAGEDGEFGELWPRGIVPKWYGIADPPLTIISANDLDIEQWNALERPDVICWHLGSSGGMTPEAVKSRITAINQDYVAKSIVPPLFVIFAESIDDSIAHELISAGATVFRNELAGRVPANPRELIEATAVMMGGTDLRQRENKFWQYAQRRMYGFPAGSSTEVVRQGNSWHRDKEIDGSTDRYRDIVDLSQPLTERKKTESGWPIDI
jgi:hypothetical protein